MQINTSVVTKNSYIKWNNLYPQNKILAMSRVQNHRVIFTIAISIGILEKHLCNVM